MDEPAHRQSHYIGIISFNLFHKHHAFSLNGIAACLIIMFTAFNVIVDLLIAQFTKGYICHLIKSFMNLLIDKCDTGNDLMCLT